MDNKNNNHLLDALTREGVLINVSVRYWRATRKLNAEDLGLDPDNVTERLISLGHKKLRRGKRWNGSRWWRAGPTA